jgi:GH24 family phage-related lysozyme (muramidase)
MSKLPTKQSLGVIPFPRGRGSLASVSVPNLSSGIAESSAQFGRGIASIGAAAEAIDGYDQKREAFEAERDFQAFQWSQHEALENAKRTVQPGQAATFGDDFTNTYTENAKGFFKQVPDRLKPAYEAKLFDTERRLYGEATTFGRAEQKRFAVQSIDNTIETVHRPRARLTPTDALDGITNDADRLFETNPDLTPIERDAFRNKSKRDIGLAHLSAQPPDQVKQLYAERLNPVSTEGLLRKFEGFRENAYWDVNAFRAGYGSDTVTRADGTIVKVTKDTKVTREDAERDLARRSVEFAGVAEKQVGEAWGALPGNVRAALTSVAYNYGKLPNNVVSAVRGGDAQQIAQAVGSLSANPGRRHQEAKVILGGSWQPEALSSLTDDDWQRAISHADTQQRLMTAEETRATALAEKQAKAAAETRESEIISDIIKGKPVSLTGIVSDPVFNQHPLVKERLIRFFEQQSKGGRDENTYGKDFYSLFQRVHASQDDPSRITDPAELYQHVGPNGGITLSGMEKLRQEIIGKRGSPDATAEAEMKRQFFAAAKAQITGSNEGLGIRDPKGDEKFLQFMTQMLPAYDAARREGKMPAQLLNPESPDYLGKSIVTFKRPMAEWFSDVVGKPTEPATKPFDPASIQTLADAVKAYNAGLINKAQADQIAIDRGWARRRVPDTLPTVPMSR